MFQSIVEALKYHAQNHANRICIVDEQSEYTYGIVWEKVQNYAANLQLLSIKEGDAVAVECTQDARYMILCLACQLLGAVFVPIENKMMRERAAQIIQEVSAQIFLYEDIILNLDNEKPIDEIEKYCEAQLFLSEVDVPDGRTVAEILFTTGTTGKSKGIVLSNENNVAIAENIIKGTEKEIDCVEIIPLPLSHSHGVRSCYANILNGSTSIITKGVMNIKWIVGAIEKYHVTALDLSPSAARILLKLSRGIFKKYSNQITCIQIGTAFLDEDLKEEMCRIFTQSRLYNFYGSTESGRTCVLNFNKVRGQKGCIGRSAVNAKFIITDKNRIPMQASAENPGLIAVSGKMNMVGYLHEKELTESTMHGGYIYTNDLGYVDKDGYIFVLGRADDVINFKGIKIMPEEIEEQAIKYKDIVDCACIARTDDMCGQIPRLYIQVKNVKEYNEEKFREFLAMNLAVSRMPQEIVIIDEIPRTTNGKLLRRKLREQE